MTNSHEREPSAGESVKIGINDFDDHPSIITKHISATYQTTAP